MKDDKNCKTAGIYILINLINSKIYYGKANNFEKRAKEHERSIRRTKEKNIAIIKAIRKYGWNNFKMYIIKEFNISDQQNMLNFESKMIELMNSNKKHIGYNIILYGNDRTSIPHTEKTKARLRITSSKYRHTQETKNKISVSNKGKIISENIRKKISDTLKENGYSKKVVQIDIKTGKCIKIWDSLTDANKYFRGYARGTIGKCCRNAVNSNGYLYKTAYGYRWKFVDK